MFSQLTINQNKNLAVVLLLVTIFLLLWLFIVPLWLDGRMYTSKADDLKFKLAKYEQAVRNEPQLKKKYADVLHQLTEAKLFYTGVASGVAAAKVQSAIREAVEKSNGNLISTQILAEKNTEHFIKIAISLRLSGSDKVLQMLLYELETLRPLLKVEKVVITSKRIPNKQRLNNQKVMNLPLNITLEISSYLLQEKGE